MAARSAGPSFGTPITASVLLHAAVVALFVLVRPSPPPASPPMYRVKMVAAPPGPPRAGVVRQQPPAVQPPVTEPTPPRPRVEPRVAPIPTRRPTARTRAPESATPTPVPAETKRTKEPAPTAGGGATGGRGTDVANVNTGGIDFPYPAYLENIIRQIRLNFKTSAGGARRAEVAFLIRRDGSVPVSSIRLVERSGSFEFDTDARGAVEAAAARGFGPLPKEFSDDVLPVFFRFDPAVLR